MGCSILLTRVTVLTVVLCLFVFSCPELSAQTDSVENKPGSGPTFVSGVITQDEVWNPAGSPYVIQGSLTIPAELSITILPGVVVKFLDSSSALNIHGSLASTGTPDAPIYFTSFKDDTVGGDTNGDGSNTSPASGDWQRIHISGPETLVEFSHTTVRYGGAPVPDVSNNASVVCELGATVSFTESTVTGSDSKGVYVNSLNQFSFSKSSVSHSRNQGLYIFESSNSEITLSSFSGNLGSGFYMYSNSASDILLKDNVSFDNSGYAFELSSTPYNFDYGNNSGYGNLYNLIFISGAIRSNITLVKNEGLDYFSLGLNVYPGVVLKIDSGVVVKLYLGNITVYGSLIAVGTEDRPIYFTSHHDKSVGYYSSGYSATPNPSPGNWGGILLNHRDAEGKFEHCVVRYAGLSPGSPSAITSRYSASISVSNCTISKNKSYGITIDSHKETVISGCDISNNGDHAIRVLYSNPSIIVGNTISGNSGDGIYIYRRGIPIYQGSVDNDEEEIQEYVEYSDDTITNKIKDNIISYNGRLAANIPLGGDIIIEGNVVYGNKMNAMYIAGNIIRDSLLGDNVGLSYIMGTIEIYPGARLTLNPGTIIRLHNDQTWINLRGTLIAEGTPANPIYFTAYNDVSVIGEPSPQPDSLKGSWRRILISGEGAEGIFKHCVIRYGGLIRTGSSVPSQHYAMISSVNGGRISLTNCTVTHSKDLGLFATGVAPCLINTIFAHNTTYGVHYDGSDAISRYCNYWENESNQLGINPDTTGTIYQDPLFVSLSIGNFSLLPSSPCIEAGEPTMLKADGTRSDIGALPLFDIPQNGVGKIKQESNLPTKQIRLPVGIVTGGTDVFNNFLYVQDLDRSSGLRVFGNLDDTPTGTLVCIDGSMTVQNYERILQASKITPLFLHPVPEPVVLNVRSIGGGNWMYDPANARGQMGTIRGFGLNNIGLLVRTQGTVTHIDPSGTGFTLWDGSAWDPEKPLYDKDGNLGVRVDATGRMPADLSLGDFVSVTAISSTERSGFNLFPLLLARFADDIALVSPIQ